MITSEVRSIIERSGLCQVYAARFSFLRGATYIMKKALFALIPALLFASCKVWNEPVEEFFSYWVSEAYISDWDAGTAKQNDNSGVTNIPSGADREVILKVENPKDFRFVMPAVGKSEMINFTGFSVQPVPGTDYTLTQLASDTLKLTYKSTFLKKHEWGTKDFGVEITLYADDGNVSTGGTSSSYGGGVCVIGNSDTGGTHTSFIFKNGTISNNTASYGGGVMTFQGGTFTMEGRGESNADYNNNIIKDNTADKSGGGVAVHGAMTMNGGSIKNNKAKDGGCGIFLWYSQSGQTTLTMTNGFIDSNDVAPGGTENKGKGVSVRFTGLTMKMSGYARISGDNDVYLTNGAKITVDSASLEPTSLGYVARITPKNYNAGTQVLTGNYVSTHNGKFKVTPNGGQTWSVGSNGYLKTP